MLAKDTKRERYFVTHTELGKEWKSRVGVFKENSQSVTEWCLAHDLKYISSATGSTSSNLQMSQL